MRRRPLVSENPNLYSHIQEEKHQLMLLESQFAEGLLQKFPTGPFKRLYLEKMTECKSKEELLALAQELGIDLSADPKREKRNL